MLPTNNQNRHHKIGHFFVFSDLEAEIKIEREQKEKKNKQTHHIWQKFIFYFALLYYNNSPKRSIPLEKRVAKQVINYRSQTLTRE